MKIQPWYIIVLRVYNDSTSKVYNVFVHQLDPGSYYPAGVLIPDPK